MRLPRAIQVERLVRHLAHARPDAVVCGVAGGGPGAGFEPEAIPPVIRVSSSPLTRLVERKTASARVRARVQSLDTDFYWWRAAAARIERQWTLGPGDLLVTFGQPWAGHRAGLRVKRRSDAKWIAHFSDPWADSPFLTEHRARQKALRHEAEVIEAADMVIFTSDETLDLVMAKYPSEWHAKAAVLPHAFEPDLYPAAEAHDGPMMIRYLGNFYGARGPEPLFHALSILGQTQPDLLAQIRVELVGDTPVRFLNSDYLRALPSETVRIIPSVGYRQSLALMQSADLLLNIDAPFERSVFLPSKLVDYIGAGRPIFGITPPGTAARLIQYLGGWVVEPGQPDRVANALETALISVAQNRTAPWGNAAIRSTFSAPVVARQFESLMKRVHAAQ
jgi:glycosyltransferase involved in cell wall biosynthesis